MSRALKKFVHEYGWVHMSLGLTGNVTFFVGSLLFLPQLEQYKTVGVWFFVTGPFLMLIGALGRLLVDLWDSKG